MLAHQEEYGWAEAVGIITIPALKTKETFNMPANQTARMTDEKWSIPESGKVDSLNLPQAAAIMMYEYTKKFNNFAITSCLLDGMVI